MAFFPICLTTTENPAPYLIFVKIKKKTFLDLVKQRLDLPNRVRIEAVFGPTGAKH